MIKIQTGFNPIIPLTHSRIGYNTFTQTGTATASSGSVLFPADAPLNSLTYEYWRPTALPATWTLDAGTSKQANYFGIASHDLGSVGSSITIQGSNNNISFTNIDSFTPTDDSTIMFLFAPATFRYWRLSITGTTTPSIGVVYVGMTLDMIRPIYGGLSPINLSRMTTIRPNKSEGGQWIGRSVIRQGTTMGVAFQNLSSSWYRANFDPFVVSAVSYPFFFAWRPQGYIDGVGYVWIDRDITPKNSGIRDLMNVSFTVMGISSE